MNVEGVRPCSGGYLCYRVAWRRYSVLSSGVGRVAKWKITFVEVEERAMCLVERFSSRKLLPDRTETDDNLHLLGGNVR